MVPTRVSTSVAIAAVLLCVSVGHAAGKFTVDGSRIIDPSGRRFVALSTNINGYQTNWKDEGKTIGDLNLVKNVWKFNHLRLYCRIYPWNTGNRQGLYNIIDTYIKQHVVVMLTYHDKTGGLFTGSELDQLISFNVEVVKKFKDHPDFTYLWFETMNEPGSKPLSDIDAMNRKFCEAIRTAGAVDNIYCAPGNNFSQEGTQWTTAVVTESQSYILSKGKGFQDWNQSKWGNRNVIFSPHFYRIWIHGDNKMATFIDDCYAKGLPIVVGEYGIETPGGSCVEAIKSMQRVGYKRYIGRSVWHWTGGDWNKLTTVRSGRDINKTDGSKPTNLTWLGGVVWDDNHSTATDIAVGWEKPYRTNFAAAGAADSKAHLPAYVVDLRGATVPRLRYVGMRARVSSVAIAGY